MTALAALALAALVAAAPEPGPTAPRTTTVALAGRPLRLAALAGPGASIDVLLSRGREVERFRLEGRTLTRAGSFLSPARRSRPLLLDAARPSPVGGDAVVAVVFGEDVQSIDQGTDTALHAFVLSAPAAGGLAPVTGDLRQYVRIVEGKIYAQARGRHALHAGPVRAVEGPPDRLGPAEPPVPWAARWLLEATPLPGGADALAFEGGTPVLVARAGGAWEEGAGIVGDLGRVREPQLAVRLEQPVYRMGMDKEGRQGETWHAVPRRVVAGADGAIHTLSRGRSRGAPLVGRATGEDAVVRLDRAGGELTLSRPYPGVEAWILDFALIERPGAAPAALLLVNDEEDGSGRAHLVLQEPR